MQKNCLPDLFNKARRMIMKKQSDLSKLMDYAGSKKCLIFTSWILAAVSTLVTLVPFYYIWKILKEVLEVAPNFAQASSLSKYGWTAVGFALGAMVLYAAALMCSHIAAFHVQANIRSKLMRHILALPMGTFEKEGTGKIRRIVVESSAATENYLAHQLPDIAGHMRLRLVCWHCLWFLTGGWDC